MKVIKTCECGNSFETTQKRLDQGRGMFCSQKCKYQFRKMPKRGIGTYNLVKENPTWFSVGHTSWQTGTKGVMKPNSGSIKKGERRSIETEFKPDTTSVFYQNNDLSYYQLHAWVRKNKGAAKKCEHCQSEDRVE